MSDFQEKWETYGKFRIVPLLSTMDSDPETQNKWVASVDIKSAEDGSLVKAGIYVEGYYASKEDAYLAAIKRGKEEIDNASDLSTRTKRGRMG